MNIPPSIRQNDTPTWIDPSMTDVEGNTLDSTGYSLAYVIAGALAAPITLNATANATGWKTTLDSVSSAKLSAGTFWWQAVLTAASFRLVVGTGELTVLPDLATVGAQFDGRTTAEKALAAAEAALATFQASGGQIKSYSINNRRIEYHTATELIAVRDKWKKIVLAERSAANGVKDRFIRMRFQRAT